MPQSISLEDDIREERLRWLYNALNREKKSNAEISLSPQGLLLQRDLEIAFFAGAWISVIVISYAAIEATARDIAIGDYESSSAKLFDSSEELQQLRKLRNQLVHVSPPGTPSVVWKLQSNDLAASHTSLEDEARRAVELVFRAIYASNES